MTAKSEGNDNGNGNGNDNCSGNGNCNSNGKCWVLPFALLEGLNDRRKDGTGKRWNWAVGWDVSLSGEDRAFLGRDSLL
jgi:hypothetical protein